MEQTLILKEHAIFWPGPQGQTYKDAPKVAKNQSNAKCKKEQGRDIHGGDA